MRNLIKTISTTTFAIATLLTGQAHADTYFWQYFNEGDYHEPVTYQPNTRQTITFDDTAHDETYFWGYYNNGMKPEDKTIIHLASFDDSLHHGTYFWGFYNAL